MLLIRKSVVYFLTFNHFVVVIFRRYCDTSVLSYQTARIPEQIRLKIGGPTNMQFSVYDEVAKNIPGFQPLTERDAALVIPKVNLPVSIKTSACFFFSFQINWDIFLFISILTSFVGHNVNPTI